LTNGFRSSTGWAATSGFDAGAACNAGDRRRLAASARVNPKIAKQAAQFLVDVSLTNPDAKEYEFAVAAAEGSRHRVIITEYDLPRKNAYPHDVVVDPDGNAWYSDFGSQVAGVLDPTTGKVIDYDIPVVRPEQPKGTLDLQLDRDGNLWIAMMYQSAIAKMDRQTRKLTVYPYPKEWLGFSTQASMVAPKSWHVDGKVWSNNQETREYYRLDVATGKFENTGKAIDKSGKQSAPTAFRPITRTTCICSSLAAPASAGATPRRSTSRSGRRRSPTRNPGAAASII
jgi:streptogramin lyase